MNGTAPSAPAAPSTRRRLTIAAEVAAVLMVGIGLLTWLFPRGGGPPPGNDVSGSQTSAPGAAHGGPTTAVEPTSPGSGQPAVFLSPADLEQGKANLVSLPRPLRGQPAYAHALTIACPSNQTTDLFREVVYPLAQRYLTFQTTVVPYREPAADRLVTVEVLVGWPQRDGTTRVEEAAAARSVRVGEQRAVGAPVEGARDLRLRVTCERPDLVVVLAEPRLTPLS